MRRARSEEWVDVFLNGIEEGFARSRRDDFRAIFVAGFGAPNDGVDGWSRSERLLPDAGLQNERLGGFAGAVVWEWGAENACSDAHLALRGG